jgi:hypothetical protein
MRRLPLLVLVATCSAAHSDPMTFRYAHNGGHCEGCRWTAADGDITSETPAQFQSYINTHGVPGYLEINSQGGDLGGGVGLGRLFRSNHVIVYVHRTVKGQVEGYPDIDGLEKGVCISACSYAFIGGETRDADSQEIGIHQFSASLSNSGHPIVVPQKTAVGDATTILSTTQAATAYLIDYVNSMGVDPRFLSLASASAKIYYLSESELDLYKVRWQPKELMPWTIRVWGSGVYALSQSRDGTLSAMVFCRADKVLHFQITGLTDDVSKLADAKNEIDSVEIFGVEVHPSAVQVISLNGRSPVLDIPLEGLDPNSIKSNTPAFDIDVVANAFRWLFTYKIPIVGAAANVSVAMKNCI